MCLSTRLTRHSGTCPATQKSGTVLVCTAVVAVAAAVAAAVAVAVVVLVVAATAVVVNAVVNAVVVVAAAFVWELAFRDLT